MDMHADNNRQISNTYHYLPENDGINIDSVAAAVAKLNYKILRLRKEIVAFKNENKSHLIAVQNSSRSTSGFNDSMKNEEKQTDARYELQRNCKGNDSPSGIDLSARLSFAKRVREIKAASEVTVFKEDYPSGDKSIENNERPNRSRMFEWSGTYRKSISGTEKFEKEIDKRLDRNVRNPGNVKISYLVDEKLRKPNRYQNKVVSNTHRNSIKNVSTVKIKKKRISRGVQYDVSIVRQSRTSRFFLNCFRSKSNMKKCNLARKIEREKNLKDNKKFDVRLQNEMNKSLDTIRFSYDIKMEKLTNNIDIKKEKFENDEDKMEKVTDINHNEKQKEKNDSLKNCKVKVNFLKKLSKVLNYNNNNLKMQQNKLQDDFNTADKPHFENKRKNDHKRKESMG